MEQDYQTLPPAWTAVYQALENYTREFLLEAVEEGLRQDRVDGFSVEGRAEVSRPMLVLLAFVLIQRHNTNPLSTHFRIDAAGKYLIDVPVRAN